jgi:hypothetical protein
MISNNSKHISDKENIDSKNIKTDTYNDELNKNLAEMFISGGPCLK